MLVCVVGVSAYVCMYMYMYCNMYMYCSNYYVHVHAMCVQILFPHAYKRYV